MTEEQKKKRRRLILVILVLAVLAVPVIYHQMGRNKPTRKILDRTVPVKFASPGADDDFVTGDVIQIAFEVVRPDEISDLKLLVNGKIIEDRLENKNQTIDYPTDNCPLGDIKIALSYVHNGKPAQVVQNVNLFSDVETKHQTAKEIAVLTHDPTSYTQGLEFYQNRLFEGTGQWGKSKLMEVDLKSGNIVRSISLSAELFGEGITILNDTIYQLTYQAGKCFVYDMNFVKLAEFHYQGEGWGLCNNGKSLLMTNGTDEVVWRDPRTFKITKRIHAYGDQTNYPKLNELELINGHLFANIYTDSKIVEIDTANGKVLSEIDCSSFVNKQPFGVDYLNGIAHDPVSGKTYLTGKLWPNMYEVTFE